MVLAIDPDRVFASEAARRHMLDKHGVEYDEAVEALLSRGHVKRIRSDSPDERRYLAQGQTDEGRRLNVVFVRQWGGRARVVTAYEPRSRKQRQRHRRRR
jgi:uncharacterized DUF497 family protein